MSSRRRTSSMLPLMALGLSAAAGILLLLQAGCASGTRSITGLPPANLAPGDASQHAPSRFMFGEAFSPDASGALRTDASPQLLAETVRAKGRTSARFAIEPFQPSGKPSGLFYSKDEELWVITRPIAERDAARDEFPGSGAMVSKQNEVPLPLKHTKVDASVSAYIATVDVTQQFHNPFDSKIEAVYVFPLPQNAAVNEFLMTIGDRRIRGIIRDRKEAEEIYKDAKSQGYVASLLTQERPNIFTQSVANIEPGKQIDVTIKYFHTLAYVDGWYEFTFPMVVGPRFNPPRSTDGIGAVARGSEGASGQNTEVQYLRPGERSGHDISLTVAVDAGVPIEEAASPSHRITSAQPEPGKLSIALAADDRVPNKDFVLRYRVAGGTIKSSLLTHRDERGGFFTLMLYPPMEQIGLQRQPMELVFVLDCSGSMSGEPLAQAKDAIERGLHLLQPGDSFQLINFSYNARQLGSAPLKASRENIAMALRHLKSLESEGGTMMITGIKAALDFPHDRERLRFVCFLTDGYIGNEAEILSETRRKLGASRIFSFGVGSSVNRYLLDDLARVGRGAVAYLGLNEDAAAVMDAFFQRAAHPAMTDLAIDWGTLRVTDTFPSQLPDLFVGRPVVVTGRFSGESRTTVRVNGRAGGRPVEVPIVVNSSDATATHPGLASVWAREKIAEVSRRALFEPSESLNLEIKRVALDYSLMSAFTAFVAVDSSRRTAGESGTTVPVAVPVPDGVKYETTVLEK